MRAGARQSRFGNPRREPRVPPEGIQMKRWHGLCTAPGMELSKSSVPVRGPGVLVEACFADIDEQAAALEGWNQRYLQLSAGVFRGTVQRLALDGVGLFIEDLQQAVHQTGWIGPQVVALGVPVLLQGDSRFCGEAGDEAALHVFSGPEGFEYRSPQRHVMLGIEVDVPLLEQFGIDTRSLTQRAHLHRGAPVALDALRQHALAVFAAAAQATPPRAQAQRRRVRDELLERLVDALAGPGSSAPTVRRSAASPGPARLCGRAHELVVARLDDPPTVAELCASLGVSRRTLQSSFQVSWGVGPLAWLNTLRLDAVRRRLKTSASVTEAATQLGFWHFGHFARDYRELFGELPSQTLRRCRTRGTGVQH
jgi:AraC family transcriptional regulator, ethanolamine operon transcriptional activator